MKGSWIAELHEARHEHTDGQHDAGLREMRCNEGGEHDHDQVHERGRRRGHGELAVAVQHAAGERRQRDEEDVGEGPAQHVDREVEAIAVGAETRREQQHQQRRGDDADDRDHRQEPGHRAHRPVDQFADLVAFALDLVLGDDRHERLRERALGEQPPHEIGNLERDQERVHEQAGPEHPGIDHVPQQAGHA